MHHSRLGGIIIDCMTDDLERRVRTDTQGSRCTREAAGVAR